MKQLAIFIFCFLSLSACKHAEDKGTTYNQKYVVGTIPGEAGFSKLSRQETLIDSIYSDYDEKVDSLVAKDSGLADNELLQKNEFIRNRSRIYMEQYTNGREARIDTVFHEGVAAPCQCLVKGDTILIGMTVGFFGGLGFDVKIARDDFWSGYHLYIDDGKPYKAALQDAFTDELKVKSKFQHLILDKKPSFSDKQQLSGYLTLTSEKYYERPFGDKLDTNYVTGKVYFTCYTKKAAAIQRSQAPIH